MRDYIQTFSVAEGSPYGITQVIAYYFFNTGPEAQAFIDANPVSPGGGTLGPIVPLWFRWNKELLNSLIFSVTNIGTGTSPVLDAKGEQIIYFESPRSLGVNSHVESAAFRSKQAKAGTQTMSFYSYLLGLQANWLSLGYPQRWLQALAVVTQRYHDAKVTQSQVTAWLNSVDLRAKATTI